MSRRTDQENGHRNVGRHLPTSGGLGETLRLAEEQGCEAIQIFVSNPQGWAEPAPREDAETFIEGKKNLAIRPVVVHAKYLINLASKDAEQRRRSTTALAREMVAAGALGADLVVVHAGSHGEAGEKAGLDRLVRGLEEARELAGGESGRRAAEVVVENSVGAGTQLCSDFDSLAEVLGRAGVRACLDTAHAFVRGYDLSTPEGASEVAREVREKLGGKVAVFHFNDARNRSGSRRDGHARLGEGKVPLESWEAFFGGLPNVPAVMETPYGTPQENAGQVALAKKLVGGLRGERNGI